MTVHVSLIKLPEKLSRERAWDIPVLIVCVLQQAFF